MNDLNEEELILYSPEYVKNSVERFGDFRVADSKKKEGYIDFIDYSEYIMWWTKKKIKEI